MKFLKYFVYLLAIYGQPLWAISLNDSGKISNTTVSEVVNVYKEADILAALQKAKTHHLPITIRGVQHSQGGQTLAEEAIQLNMLHFNKVLALNLANKQVTVQSGITWGDLQQFINPHQLAVTAMQSPNIFTVGGSLSVNAHGDDFRIGAVGNSIVSFTILLANGQRLVVSPTQHPALWRAVRGGYGLLGVVSDVTLQLTDNHMLLSHFEEMPLDNFLPWFKQRILQNKDVALFYAHVNISLDTRFLNTLYAIYYSDTQKLPDQVIALENPERWNAILTPLFNVSRLSNNGKRWRWENERKIFRKMYNGKLVTRNNAMEKPVRFAFTQRSDKADWLQEYFIPVEKLPQFMDALRNIMAANAVNLLNVTIRYVPAEKDILLTQARTDSLAIVIYFEQDITGNYPKQAAVWTQQLIDAALKLDGTYYLTYQNFASVEQFHQAYPRYQQFAAIKQQVDKDTLFNNRFYQTYFKAKAAAPPPVVTN